MRRKFVLVLVVFCAGAFSLAIASSTSRAASGGTHEVMTAAFVRSLGKRIAAFQQATWHWQRLMGVPLSQTEGRTLAEMNVDDAAGAAELWRRRAAAAEARAKNRRSSRKRQPSPGNGIDFCELCEKNHKTTCLTTNP